MNVAASLYGIGGSSVRPAVILVHGNTPLGRKLALYRVLSERLAERGYIVLAIDQTGFGESGDPFSLNSKEALNNDKDVYAALNYLENLKIVDKTRIYIIGHSGGAIPSFNVGIKVRKIRKIIAIGPPRRVRERFSKGGDIDYFWKRAQRTRERMYKKPFPQWYTKDLWLSRVIESNMKKYIPYFSQENHKPLLLIDGEREDKADKNFLTNYYSRISTPKAYKTIPNSDHYFNTMTLLNLCIFDRRVVNKAVGEIDHWLRSKKEV